MAAADDSSADLRLTSSAPHNTLVQHEKDAKVLARTASELFVNFNHLLDAANAEPSAVTKTFQALTSALSLWRRCLEGFMNENRDAVDPDVLKLLEMNKVEWAEVKDRENIINAKYQHYKGAYLATMTPPPDSVRPSSRSSKSASSKSAKSSRCRREEAARMRLEAQRDVVSSWIANHLK